MNRVGQDVIFIVESASIRLGIYVLSYILNMGRAAFIFFPFECTVVLSEVIESFSVFDIANIFVSLSRIPIPITLTGICGNNSNSANDVNVNDI